MANWNKCYISIITAHGDLNYPVGLITADEMIYAVARWSANNSNYYLYGNYRIRPVISLKASLEVEGDGSASNPFVFLG